jgi:hypothetical protein
MSTIYRLVAFFGLNALLVVVLAAPYLTSQ